MSYPYPVILSTPAGDLKFNDTFDAYGYWSVADLPGWWGHEMKQTLLDTPGAGKVVGQNEADAKSVTILAFAGAADARGWYVAADRVEQIIESLLGSAEGYLTVDQPNATKRLTVVFNTGGLGLARRGQLPPAGTPGEVKTGFAFQIPLLAPNPMKATL